jgi:hypothetical protein
MMDVDDAEEDEAREGSVPADDDLFAKWASPSDDADDADCDKPPTGWNAA